MKFIDKLVEGLGLVEEEEYYEDELEQEEKLKEEKKAEKKPFFSRKEKEVPATEAAETPAKKKGFSLSLPFGKKKEEEKEAAVAETTITQPQVEAKTEAPAKKPMFSGFKKTENKEKEAPMKKEPAFKEKKRPERTINLPIDSKQVNVVIIEPVDFNDSPKIADYLRKGQPVVVNFEGLEPVVTKRMTDFISGTIYAMSGSMKKLGRNILVCAPRNVEIDAGVEYEEKGEQPWKR